MQNPKVLKVKGEKKKKAISSRCKPVDIPVPTPGGPQFILFFL